MGGVDRAYAARPCLSQIDAAGETIPFQFPNEFQLGRSIQDLGVDPGRAVTEDQSGGLCQLFSEPCPVFRPGVGVLDSAALKLDPPPISEFFKALEIVGVQVFLAHPLIACNHHIESFFVHGLIVSREEGVSNFLEFD